MIRLNAVKSQNTLKRDDNAWIILFDKFIVTFYYNYRNEYAWNFCFTELYYHFRAQIC